MKFLLGAACVVAGIGMVRRPQTMWARRHSEEDGEAPELYLKLARGAGIFIILCGAAILLWAALSAED